MNSVWLPDRYLSHKEIKFADDEGKVYESETPILYLVAKENSVFKFQLYFPQKSCEMFIPIYMTMGQN